MIACVLFFLLLIQKLVYDTQNAVLCFLKFAIYPGVLFILVHYFLGYIDLPSKTTSFFSWICKLLSMFAGINNATINNLIHIPFHISSVYIYIYIPIRFLKLGLQCQRVCVLVIFIDIANTLLHSFTTTAIIYGSVFAHLCQQIFGFQPIWCMKNVISQYSFNLYFFYMREVEHLFIC